MKTRAPRLRSTILATALAVGTLAPLAAPAAAAPVNEETLTVNVSDPDGGLVGEGEGLDGMVVRAYPVNADGSLKETGDAAPPPTVAIPIVMPGGGEYELTLTTGSWKVEAYDPRSPASNQTEYGRVWSGQAKSFASASVISIDGDDATSHSISLEMAPGGFINVQLQDDAFGQFIVGQCVAAYDAATGDFIAATYNPTTSAPNSNTRTQLVSLQPGSYKMQFAGDPLLDCEDAKTTHAEEWYEDKTSLATSSPSVGVEADTTTTIAASLAAVNTNRTISGRVTANGSGNSLQAIRVTATPIGGGSTFTTSTNSSGNYSLAVTAGQYKVDFTDLFTADNVDYAREWWNNRRSAALATTVDVRDNSVSGINAALDEAGSISGEVEMADGPDEGNSPDPVEGAIVDVYFSNDSTTIVGTATTDASGDFTVTGLFPDTYRMRVRPPSALTNLATEWWEDASDFATADGIQLNSGQDKGGIDTFLDESATISGVVRDDEGDGLAEICVAAYTPGGEFRTFTTSRDDDPLTAADEAGKYSLSGLAVGEYRIRFSDGDDANCGGSTNLPGIEWASEWHDNRTRFEASNNVRLDDDGIEGIDARLAPAAGTISGTATKGATNAPVAAPNVCVRIVDSSNNVLRERVTNNSGFWNVGGLPAGTSVRVEYRPNLTNGDGCFSTAADRLGGTGNPTDQSDLINQWFEDKRSFPDATPVGLFEGTNVANLDEFLEGVASSPTSGTASISGIVTEPDGTDSGTAPDPVAGVCVIAVPVNWNHQESFAASATASTTPGGAYTISNLAENTLFRIRYSNDPQLCTDLPSTPSGLQQTGFNVTQWYANKDSFDTANAVLTGGPNTTVANINEELPYAGVITGAVTDADLGGGIQADVRIYRAEDGVEVREVRTNANGTYKVGGLPLGAYKVEFDPVAANYRPEFHNNTENLAAATVVSVTKDASVNVSAALDANHAPSPGDDNVQAEVNKTTVFNDLTANDLDQDGDDVTIISVSAPSHGTTVLREDGSVSFTPEQDNTDTATFTYTVEDTGGLTGQATVTVTMVGQIIGAPPVAADDEADTARNTSVTIDVLANDTDPDGDDSVMFIDGVGTPFHGTAAISNGRIVYTPDTNFTGIDQFIYQVEDSQGFQDTAKVTVNVGTASNNAVNTTVAAGGTAGTNGTSASPDNVIITTVTSPNAGAISISETTSARTTSNGLTIIEPRVEITAPNATASNPLTITFRIDGSVLDGLQPQRAIRVLRNGAGLADCLGSAVASPDPCIAGHQRIADDVLLTIRTSRASTWTFGFLDEAVVDRAFSPGADRVDTAVRVARQAFSPSEVDTVVIARSDTYPDALAGAPLAHQVGGPLLLTNRSALDVITRDEILRLKASKVIILGGPAAVSTGVENALRNLQGVQSVERIFGNDRYETAEAVAKRLDPYTSAYVVEGQNDLATRGWPDAVSVASLAAFQGRPIFLVTRDVLPTATRRALSGLSGATIVGGFSAVSQGVQTQVDQVVGTVNRIAGDTRYETNYQVALAARNAGMSVSSIWIATGTNFPDALAAGAAVAKEGGLLLLVNGQNYGDSPRVREMLTSFRNQVESVTIAGGPAAVSATVEAQIRQDTTT